MPGLQPISEQFGFRLPLCHRRQSFVDRLFVNNTNIVPEAQGHRNTRNRRQCYDGCGWVWNAGVSLVSTIYPAAPARRMDVTTEKTVTFDLIIRKILDDNESDLHSDKTLSIIIAQPEYNSA